jgi:hypothetical protein
MSVSNALEPPNVYFGFGSISGNTFVSDAAASTVGVDIPLPVVVLAPAPDDVVGAAELELEPLLPQPAASADTAIVMAAAEIRRVQGVLIKTIASLSLRQDAGTLMESWQA